MGTSERKQREREARRSQIIQGALQVLDETGTCNMEKVGQACELSKGTSYIYFKTQKDLELHLATWVARDLRFRIHLGEPGVVAPAVKGLGEYAAQFPKRVALMLKSIPQIEIVVPPEGSVELELFGAWAALFREVVRMIGVPSDTAMRTLHAIFGMAIFGGCPWNDADTYFIIKALRAP